MIAAGEVVEGPFSVIKELIENSMDAGASVIDVQVYDSGLKKIIVKDNGSGIVKDDIALSIKEHATSKISDESQLHNIVTYGFRGEALSSIASISDIIILSKTSGESIGSRLESNAGKVLVSDFAGDKGTTVIVENLFYNIPARKKFLKSKQKELRNIRETIIKMAIPAYNISFTLNVDSMRELSLAATDSLDERIKQVFGKSVLQNLYYEELSDIKVKLKGYLSKPEFVKNSRSMQFLFVNNRAIEYKFFSYHISRAYNAIIPKGKYAAAIIFIEIDPELIDVNIHPAKREVKLFDQKYIDDMIFNLASKSLNRSHTISETFFTSSEDRLSDGLSDRLSDRVSESRNSDTQVYKTPPASQGKFFKEQGFRAPLFDIKDEPISVNHSVTVDQKIKILGTLFNTYILFEEDDKLHLIDFHAAHERLIYDRLIQDRKEIEFQELIFPVSIELPIDEFALVKDNIEIFNEIGFEIEEFSDYTIIVRTAPIIAGNDNIDELIKNMIDNIKIGIKSNDLAERFYSLIACHSAKRAGDLLNTSDMESLVRKVLHGNMELRCPHGRPFIFTISQSDLERMFKRI
jgi:DNA mismatch repair protein MutL